MEITHKKKDENLQYEILTYIKNRNNYTFEERKQIRDSFYLTLLK